MGEEEEFEFPVNGSGTAQTSFQANQRSRTRDQKKIPRHILFTWQNLGRLGRWRTGGCAGWAGK